MVIRVTSTKRYCITEKDIAACHNLTLFKRPTVKSGAIRDDQSVQNQMRQFTVTLLHTPCNTLLCYPYNNIMSICIWYKVTGSSSHDPCLSLNDIQKICSKDTNTEKLKL